MNILDIKKSTLLTVLCDKLYKTLRGYVHFKHKASFLVIFCKADVFYCLSTSSYSKSFRNTIQPRKIVINNDNYRACNNNTMRWSLLLTFVVRTSLRSLWLSHFTNQYLILLGFTFWILNLCVSDLRSMSSYKYAKLFHKQTLIDILFHIHEDNIHVANWENSEK